MQGQFGAKDLSMVLGTRQKRLEWLKSQLSTQNLNPSKLRDATDLLRTYALVLAKLARAAGTEEQRESSDRLQTIDRELSSIFETARLETARAGAFHPSFKPS